MSNSLFRTKKIENILAEGSDDPHGGGGLKRVLTVRDLTFFWYCCYYRSRKF